MFARGVGAPILRRFLADHRPPILERHENVNIAVFGLYMFEILNQVTRPLFAVALTLMHRSDYSTFSWISQYIV